MNIDDNKSTKRNLLKLSKSLSDKSDCVEKLRADILFELHDTFGSVLFACSLKVSSPVDLRTVKYTLTSVFQDPVIPGVSSVFFNRDLKNVTDRHVHHLLDFTHPIFNFLIARVNRCIELNLFLLSRHHSYDSGIWFEFHIIHVLEHFLQMRSHVLHLLGLRQDFKQVIGGKEIETSKDSAFLLKIVLKTTLYLFKVIVASLESLKQTNVILELACARCEHVGVSLSALDNRLPGLVHSLELFGFSWQLLRDII